MSTPAQPIQTQSSAPKWAVQAPDGKVIQFPDQFTDQDVSREMTKMYPPNYEQQAAQNPPVAPAIPKSLATDRSISGNWTLTPKQQQAQGAYASTNLKPIGETLGTMATSGMLPFLKGAGVVKNILPFLGRAGLSGAGMGAGALAAGASPQEAKTAAETGAVAQPVAEGLSAGLKSMAPKMAESALNITDRMRGRGRTIGQSVLKETQGVAPETIASQSQEALGKMTGQMEDAVHQATLKGVTGTTQPAHAVLNDAIDKVPRNAVTIREKLGSLHNLLDLDRTPMGPVRAQYTPDELLEMKRGIGKEIETWPPEWQKISDVKQVKQKLYGAIDAELDRAVPGNAGLNQRISSLIPAKQQAMRISDAASVPQRIAHRMAAHTGALAGSGIGSVLGYREGGAKGALLGGAAGLAIPELIASPTAQMTAARLSNAGGGIASPYVLPFLKTGASQLTKPSKKQNNAEQQ